MKKLGLVALLVVLTLIVTPAIVKADPWSAIDSGYAITTNHFGEEIVPPPDPPLRAKVGVLTEIFDSLKIYEVRVDLRDPDGNVVASDTVSVFLDGTSPKGAPIKWAETDDLVPAEWVVGDYSVKAYFFAHNGKQIAHTIELTAMRATTVMVVPELGTILLAAASFSALALYALKRRKFH